MTIHRRWHRAFLGAAFCACGAMMLGGCISERAGVGLPMARVYESTTVPLTASRPERGRSGILIPSDLRLTEVRTHQIKLDIPAVGPPMSGNLPSIGWGDMSKAAEFGKNNYDQFVFADAHKLSILGIYTRITIQGYGTSEME